MPSPFSITSATNSLRLDERRRSQTTFTVFNAAGRPLRGRARLVPDDEAAQPWLMLEGEAERPFAIAGTEQYAVKVKVPEEVPAGSYTFRLDMVDVENPDEGHVQGPAVTFEVEEGGGTGGEETEWWKVLVAAGVLVLVGLGAYFLLDELLNGDDQVEVPDVAGMTVIEANAELRAEELIVGETEQVANDTLAAGLIIRSSPEAEATVEKRSHVKLIVSTGPTLDARFDKAKELTMEWVEAVDNKDVETLVSLSGLPFFFDSEVLRARGEIRDRYQAMISGEEAAAEAAAAEEVPAAEEALVQEAEAPVVEQSTAVEEAPSEEAEAPVAEVPAEEGAAATLAQAEVQAEEEKNGGSDNAITPLIDSLRALTVAAYQEELQREGFGSDRLLSRMPHEDDDIVVILMIEGEGTIFFFRRIGTELEMAGFWG